MTKFLDFRINLGVKVKNFTIGVALTHKICSKTCRSSASEAPYFFDTFVNFRRKMKNQSVSLLILEEIDKNWFKKLSFVPKF